MLKQIELKWFFALSVRDLYDCMGNHRIGEYIVRSDGSRMARIKAENIEGLESLELCEENCRVVKLYETMDWPTQPHYMVLMKEAKSALKTMKAIVGDHFNLLLHPLGIRLKASNYVGESAKWVMGGSMGEKNSKGKALFDISKVKDFLRKGTFLGITPKTFGTSQGEGWTFQTDQAEILVMPCVVK